MLLHEAIKEKNWDVLFANLNDEVAIENLFRILDELEDCEADLFLVLVKKYIFASPNDILALTSKLVKDKLAKLSENFDKVVVLPLKESSSDALKSGSYVAYAVGYALKRALGNSNKVSIKENITFLCKRHEEERYRTLIVFADDFVGSGNSVVKTYTDYSQNFERPNDEAVIFSTFVLSCGLENVTSQGIDIIFDSVLLKGISNAPEIHDKENALNIMKGISSRLSISRDYYLGFLNSEALFSTANRSPNNTFPVFWCSRRKDRSEWPAPFPR